MTRLSSVAISMHSRAAPPLFLGRPRCVLSAISDYADKALEKRSVNDLLQMALLTHEDRAMQLHETLKVGLARCAVRLAEMPFGFCNASSIKRVSAAYVQDFRNVVEFEHKYGLNALAGSEYSTLTRNMLNRHRGTMLDVATGIFEYREDLADLFGPNFELVEMRTRIKEIKDIEHSLDDFFMTRLTVRLLITHVHTLHQGESSEGIVGIVNPNTQPIAILSRAYSAARFMCIRDLKAAPGMLVNGVGHEDYALQESRNKLNFPYVHSHLFYIFLELIKNAARASIEQALAENALAEMDDSVQVEGRKKKLKIPPLQIVVPEDALWDQERAIKLADVGTGMTRSVLSKSFSYFFSSAKTRPTVAREVSDFNKQAPLAGFGFGLPISRVMARYFSGDIDLNSIPGKGTDVYVYL